MLWHPGENGLEGKYMGGREAELALQGNTTYHHLRIVCP